MNILVTGAGGFLGSALVKALKQKGYYVRVLLQKNEAAANLHGLEIEVCIGNILDKERMKEVVKGIDVIFHSAAIFSLYPFYIKNPKKLYLTNIQGTKNLCEAAVEARVKKIIYTSSAGTIGKTSDGKPADESIDLNILEKRSHYEKAKANAEKVVFSYQQKGIDVISINPSFLFGIQDYRPGPSGETIVKFLNCSFPCYFNANICVADLETTVEAHLKAIEKGKPFQRYIIVHPRTYTIKEIFDLLEDVTGIQAPRIKLPIKIVYLFSLINELFLGILGLQSKIKPIINSEMVKYFMLNAKYDGAKATNIFGLKHRPFRDVLCEEVKWFYENGYVKRKTSIKKLSEKINS